MVIGDFNQSFSVLEMVPSKLGRLSLWSRDVGGVSFWKLLPETDEISGSPRRELLRRAIDDLGDVHVRLITTDRFEALLKERRLGIVAVIVPTYNVRDFIANALESIFAQTYSPVMTLVVDDGSTDGTAELVQEIMEVNSQVAAMCILKIPHVGWPSITRNVALYNLLCPSVEYVGFMDGDDLYATPRAIDVLASALARNSKAFAAFGDLDRVSEIGYRLSGPRSLTMTMKGQRKWRKSRELTWENLARGEYDVFHFQGLLMRVGLPFIPYQYRGQDAAYYHMLFRVSADTREGQLSGLIQVPELVFHYRQRRASITNVCTSMDTTTMSKTGREGLLDCKRPVAPDDWYEAIGMPLQHRKEDYVTEWLAKQWVDELLRGLYRGDLNRSIRAIRCMLEDERVRKRHLFQKLLGHLTRGLKSPGMFVEVFCRIRERFFRAR